MLTEYTNPRHKSIYDEISKRLEPKFDVNLPEIVDHNEYGYRSKYLNLPNIRRAFYPIEYSQAMIDEMARCKEDILYFAERYFYIRVPGTGRIKIPLRDYQKEFLRAMEYPELTDFEFLAARQSAKSTTMTVRMLHSVVFNSDYQIAIAAQKPGTAGEIFSRVRMAYEELPLWLQPGVVEWAKGSCVLGNASKIFAAGSTPEGLRGFSLDELLVDEAAFLKNDEEFFKAVVPTLEANPQSKFIMATTPNGRRGNFYENWVKALAGKNDFFTMGVPWWLVPGRDEKWKQKTIEKSTVTAFRQEHGLEFSSTERALVSNETIEMLEKKIIPPVQTKEATEIWEAPIKGHEYALIVDTAEGKGGDASTFTIFDVSSMPYRQVVTYQSNTISPLIYGTLINRWATHYNDALVLVENNNASGAFVAYQLQMVDECDNLYCMHSKDETGIGIRTTTKVKSLGCSTLTSMLDASLLEIRSAKTLLELQNFEAKGSSYEAASGSHDDLVQNLWLFAWFTTRPEFDEFIENGSIITAAHTDDIEDIKEMEMPGEEKNDQSDVVKDFW